MSMEQEDFQQELTDEEVQLLLDGWRQQYGAVFMTEIEGVNFIWKELSRAEYKRVLAYSEDSYERAEFACKLCVLDPMIEDYTTDIYAGVPETLAEQIMAESGFTNDTQKFDALSAQGDQEMSTLDNQIGVIIHEVFKEFTLEEIENWGLERTMWYYARAKWALEVLRGVKLERVDETQMPQL